MRKKSISFRLNFKYILALDMLKTDRKVERIVVVLVNLNFQIEKYI